MNTKEEKKWIKFYGPNWLPGRIDNRNLASWKMFSFIKIKKKQRAQLIWCHTGFLEEKLASIN